MPSIKTLVMFPVVGVSGAFIVSNLDLIFHDGPSNIRSKLIRDGFRLLSSDSNYWRLLWSKHEEENSLREKLPILVNSLESFKIACEKVIQFTDLNTYYSHASRWCTVPQDFEDRLKFIGNKEIPESDGIWGDLVSKYEKDSNNSFSTSLRSQNTQELKIKELQKFCKDTKEKNLKTYDKAFLKEFSLFLTWCTKR
ncbi:hypothetical protein MHC_01895 [Mycoplasma haemocanis str. Illinois]|uniref:Uncharacterized protein n=1 Tax=Mycoplasma haemocanis (strain Illinois) TaxID=1111676 RepID=H6N6H3_MYCHN|nr:hypothetical protein [Mycoplasma haemocanis]AEW45245.1 hypothetical protein MHC_01895 [Mycoplasma haemocanis str. Illinois]